MSLSPFIFIWLLTTIATVVISMVMLVQTNRANDLSTIKVNTVEQLEKYWIQQPFVSINARDKCFSFEENLFGVVWPGTRSGCYHKKSLYTNGWVEVYLENSIYNARKSQDQKRDCDFIFPRKAVEMNVLNGKQICGRRGGLSFSKVQRVDPLTL